MTLVALTMGTLSPSPAWMNDYTAARAKVSVDSKPMAVFVASGKAGWESVVRDGFDPAVTKLLNEKFVCLYVDSSTAAGKTLAGAFQVGNLGVVLSDRKGTTQSYAAAGTISRSELTQALIAHADVEVAQKTDAPKAAPAAPGAAPAPPMMAAPVYMGGNNCNTCGTGCYSPCNTGCNTGCGTSHGCCFMSKCGWGGGCGHSTGCAPAPCAQPACGTSHGHGCCFMSKCGWGGGCGTSCGYSSGCGTCK
jgi:hypothetical protein